VTQTAERLLGGLCNFIFFLNFFESFSLSVAKGLPERFKVPGSSDGKRAPFD